MDDSLLLNLENPHKKHIHALFILVLLCIAILAVILGYIYYGIYTAEHTAVVTEETEEQAPVNTESTTLTQKQKETILDSLSKGGAAVVGSKEKMNILESITEEETTEKTKAEKKAILDALSQ